MVGRGVLLLVVVASVGCGGPASPTSVAPGPLGLTSQEFDERLEALLLGTGPLSPRGNAGCSPGQLSGLSALAPTFSLIFSSRTIEVQRDAVVRVFSAYRDAARMTFALETSVVDEVPAPNPGEFTFDVFTAAGTVCSNPNAVGCAIGGGTSKSLGQVFLGNTSAELAGHEAGHLIGLCHITATTGTTGQTAMLGAGALGPLDVEVLKKVYGAGLRPGATKEQFVRAGVLPRPQ
jgi:hypothetical protein